MSLSLVTFADLGRRTNKKTGEALSVIEKFLMEKELCQVICRINKDFYFPGTQPAVSLPVHYFLRGTEEYLFRSFPARKIEEDLFDRRARGLIKKADAVLFYPARFPRTLEKAKEEGSITIGVGAEASPRYVAELDREESKRLGLRPRNIEEKRLSSDVTDKADYILALSDFVKDSYVRYGFPAEKIFTASLDIDKDKFSPSPDAKKDKFRVIFVSDISILKGLHYLLEAWETLRLKNSELVILGQYKKADLDPELEKRYEDRIKKDPSIKFLGHVSNPEEYINNSSVLVFPSLAEGFGKVTLEAMGCGAPVVTTENAKGVVEDGKNGFVVPTRDPKALAEKIKFLADNPKEAARMGEAARQSFLTKPDFGSQVFDIYKKILLKENKLAI
ncbi:MAG: glycosyltransferase [Candidatus Paceibacterota bacterium]|jgi:glycosyltransferase involved in cell wall biosynthesis